MPLDLFFGFAAASVLLIMMPGPVVAPQDLSADASVVRKSAARTYAEAFLVGISNPKALMFYAAFFPLFISPDRPVFPQLLIMAATYLTVAVTLDSGWALAAARARPLLIRAGRWTNRVTGGVLILAAAGLAAVRRA